MKLVLELMCGSDGTLCSCNLLAPKMGKGFVLIIIGRCINISFKWLPKNDYDKISSDYDQEIWKTEQNEEELNG